MRATSDDGEIIGLMGADRRHLFAIATALASALVAIAGVLMAVKTNFDPSAGPIRLLFAFEAVIIGGLGSLWGTLAGGIILGAISVGIMLLEPRGLWGMLNRKRRVTLFPIARHAPSNP